METCDYPKSDFTEEYTFSNLPYDMQVAIGRSGEGTQNKYDDATMGHACGKGYCSQDLFKTTAYCACVNAPSVPWPACGFGPCSNNSHAYKPMYQQKWLDKKQCPDKLHICQNLSNVSGTYNKAELYQSFDCDNATKTTEPATDTIKNTSTTTFQSLASNPIVWLVCILIGGWFVLSPSTVAPPVFIDI